MLQTIIDKETSEIIVRGEFFELDKIYFLIERLAGNYGIPERHYLPAYENAASLLLGLNYEIRHAEMGDRELYVSYNGIHDNWIAPAGTPKDRIISYEYEQEQEKKFSHFDDVIWFDVDMDPFDFYDLPEDEQEELLEEADPYMDIEEIEEYLAWLNRKQTYYFREEDYPGASNKNTCLQFRIPFLEGALYAFVLDTLLSMKTDIIENGIQTAGEEPDGMREYELDFSIRRLPKELSLLEVLKEQLFSCISETCEREAYIELRKKEAPKDFFRNMTDADIQVLSDLLEAAREKTSREEQQPGLDDLLGRLFTTL